MKYDFAVDLITNLGSFGFILWLVHRTFSVIIPRLVKGFEDSIKAMQESFNEQSDKQRQDFKEIVGLQRLDFERVLKREQEIHEAQTSRIIKALEDFSDGATKGANGAGH